MVNFERLEGTDEWITLTTATIFDAFTRMEVGFLVEMMMVSGLIAATLAEQGAAFMSCLTAPLARDYGFKPVGEVPALSEETVGRAALLMKEQLASLAGSAAPSAPLRTSHAPAPAPSINVPRAAKPTLH
jgi:hypothetical protein